MNILLFSSLKDCLSLIEPFLPLLYHSTYVKKLPVKKFFQHKKTEAGMGSPPGSPYAVSVELMITTIFSAMCISYTSKSPKFAVRK